MFPGKAASQWATAACLSGLLQRSAVGDHSSWETESQRCLYHSYSAIPPLCCLQITLGSEMSYIQRQGLVLAADDTVHSHTMTTLTLSDVFQVHTFILDRLSVMILFSPHCHFQHISNHFLCLTVLEMKVVEMTF